MTNIFQLNSIFHSRKSVGTFGAGKGQQVRCIDCQQKGFLPDKAENRREIKRIMFASNDPYVSSSGETGPLSSNLYKVRVSSLQGGQDIGLLHPHPTQHLFSSASATSESLRSEKPSKTIHSRHFLPTNSAAAEHRQRLQELGALSVCYSECP